MEVCYHFRFPRQLPILIVQVNECPKNISLENMFINFW